MTVRHYYTDAYTTEFEATVVAVEAAQTETDGPVVLLDATYFYPTSGGQANDLGTLGGSPVVDVVAAEDGTVRHLLAAGAPLPAVGAAVHGIIDWTRRFDHMQQHSGQHLLSQICYRLFELETVSVHFGATESTLDLDGELTPEQIAQVETAANELVYTALPIRAYFVDESDLGQVPLRRPPKVSGQIRIVEIERYDYSACGGTHVHTTAEIGPIKLLRGERRRDQTRVTFLCGGRALADYRRKHDLLTETAALYSTDVSQVPELVAKAQDQIKQLQRRVDQLTTDLLTYEVSALRAQAEPVGGFHLVRQVWAERSVDALKTAANLLTETPGTVALLATTNGDKTNAVFARAADVDAHMGNLLRAALQAFGGRGGGRPEFAQGGGVAADQADALLAFARDQLAQAG